MADPIYSTLKTWFDNNIDTNDNNEITGEDMNDALTYLLTGMAGKVFDSSRPYRTGQLVVKEDATYGWEVWMANSDLEAGAWDADNFTRISTRKKAWTDWTPTLTWSGGTPSAPTTVARYEQREKRIDFYIMVRGTNDSGSTLTALTISLPVTPKDVNALLPVDGAAAPDSATPKVRHPSYIDAENNTAGNRKLYASGMAFSILNEASYIFIFRGFYEVE
jgi:hypothetical protein